jgi:hypothetical protein
MFDKIMDFFFVWAMVITTILLTYITVCIIFFPSKLNAMPTPPDVVKCEYFSPDVGHITGLGEDQYKAQGNAATQCFERRVELYKRLRRENPSEDRQLLFIDACVNLLCGDNYERKE